MAIFAFLLQRGVANFFCKPDDHHMESFGHLESSKDSPSFSSECWWGTRGRFRWALPPFVFEDLMGRFWESYRRAGFRNHLKIVESKIDLQIRNRSSFERSKIWRSISPFPSARKGPPSNSSFIEKRFWFPNLQKSVHFRFGDRFPTSQFREFFLSPVGLLHPNLGFFREIGFFLNEFLIAPFLQPQFHPKNVPDRASDEIEIRRNRWKTLSKGAKGTT